MQADLYYLGGSGGKLVNYYYFCTVIITHRRYGHRKSRC